MLQPEYKSIVLDEKNKPTIEGTGIKVRELVKDYLAYGWSPEEMQWQHPSLTMAQVHAAFAYYWDHKQEIDEEIERGFALYKQLYAQDANSPVRQKLRALKRL